MTHAVGIAQAKAQFAKLVDRASGGEEIVITRNGKAVARIVPMGGGVDGHARILTGESEVAGRDAPPVPPVAGIKPGTPTLPVGQRPGLTLVEMMRLTR